MQPLPKMPRAVARTVKPVEKGPLVFNGKPLVPNGASCSCPSRAAPADGSAFDSERRLSSCAAY